MKERLNRAYDRMVMPQDCSRRIEQALRQRLEMEVSQGRQVKILRKAPRRRGWARGLAAACLAAVLSVGGVGVFLGASQGTLRPWETTVPGQSTGILPQREDFTLTQEGKDFLTAMCYYMPDWAGDNGLGDSFWTDFIFASFTSPEIDDEGNVRTIAGPAELTADGSRVRVSQAAAADYVRLALGREMPQFRLDGQGVVWPVEREGEDFLVSLSDFGSMEYAFQSCAVYGEGADRYAAVTFRELSGDRIVEFSIAPADNANGFTITGKLTREGEGTRFQGEYTDLATGEPGLKVLDSGEGILHLELTLHRVASLTCVGIQVGDRLYFSTAETPWERPTFGTVTMLDGDRGLVSISSPGWIDDQNTYEFTKVRNETDLTVPDLAPVEGTIWAQVDQSAQKLAMAAFAQGFVAGDLQTMSYCAVPELELDKFSADTTYTLPELLDVERNEEGLESFNGGPVGYVQFRAGSDPRIWELTLELDRRVNGWMVRSFTLAEAGDRATDKALCKVAARDFTKAWLAGDRGTMESLLTADARREDLPGEPAQMDWRDACLDPSPKSDGTWNATSRFWLWSGQGSRELTMTLEPHDGAWKIQSYSLTW